MYVLAALCVLLPTVWLLIAGSSLPGLVARQRFTLEGSRIGWGDYASRFPPAELPHVVRRLRESALTAEADHVRDWYWGLVGEVRQRMAYLGVPTGAAA